MRSMFSMPLSCVSFIDHVITTMFPDCKLPFKELESSGFIMCVGSSCLLCISVCLFRKRLNFYVFNGNFSFKIINWCTSSSELKKKLNFFLKK